LRGKKLEGSIFAGSCSSTEKKGGREERKLVTKKEKKLADALPEKGGLAKVPKKQ